MAMFKKKRGPCHKSGVIMECSVNEMDNQEPKSIINTALTYPLDNPVYEEAGKYCMSDFLFFLITFIYQIPKAIS